MKEEVSAVYPIGVAQRLTGLTARQIRYWEQQGLLTLARTPGGQRLFSDADILKLKEIKRLLAEGMTLQQVRAYYANREARRARLVEQVLPSRMGERIPARGGSLYTGGSLERLWMDRKPGK